MSNGVFRKETLIKIRKLRVVLYSRSGYELVVGIKDNQRLSFEPTDTLDRLTSIIWSFEIFTQNIISLSLSWYIVHVLKPVYWGTWNRRSKYFICYNVNVSYTIGDLFEYVEFTTCVTSYSWRLRHRIILSGSGRPCLVRRIIFIDIKV